MYCNGGDKDTVPLVDCIGIADSSPARPITDRDGEAAAVAGAEVGARSWSAHALWGAVRLQHEGEVVGSRHRQCLQKEEKMSGTR